MSQYDIEKFEPPPDPDLVCCICQCVLDKAVESPCRHVFCQACIERWLTNRHTCPTCRKKTKKQDLKPVLPLVQNMLNRLIMKCDYRDNGCLEKIMLEQFEKHVQNCGYEMKTCRFSKCGAKILKMHWASHEQTICEHRESVCEGECGLMVPLSEKCTHNCVAALKAHIEEKNRMIETLKTKLQELNNLSQSLNDQLEQLRQQLNHRSHFISLSSFSSSESDETDFMSETLSDESVFEELQAARSQDNDEGNDAENNNENTNTASDVVEQVERTIVTTLFDVTSRLEVVRNQMRTVLDEGFVNDNDSLQITTPALNAIVNNNATIGTSLNANHTNNRNYHGGNNDDLSSNRFMETLSSLITRSGDSTEPSTEAQDGDVFPDHPSPSSNNSPGRNSSVNTYDIRDNSFTDFENVESNRSVSVSEYSDLDRSYQVDSHGEDQDGDRNTDHVSAGSSRSHSFSDHYSGDGRLLPEHVIVSEPPDSPSNTNSSFTSSSSSIPTFSSTPPSPCQSPLKASTPQQENEGPSFLGSDFLSHLNDNSDRVLDTSSSVHNSFFQNHYLYGSSSSPRSDTFHDTLEPTRSVGGNDSDTRSSMSDHAHLIFSGRSKSSACTLPRSSPALNLGSVTGSGDDMTNIDRNHHGSEQRHVIHSDGNADNVNHLDILENDSSDHASTSYVRILSASSGRFISKGYKDRSVNREDNTVLSDRNSANSSASTDDVNHIITLSPDTSDESDKSESIKYLTKRLKHVKKEDNSSVGPKAEIGIQKSDNDTKAGSKTVSDRSTNEERGCILFSRKRRAHVLPYSSAYKCSNSKRPNLNGPSYGAVNDVHCPNTSVLSSHTISSSDQGSIGRRTRSSTVQTSAGSHNNNSQSLNVKIDLSLINYSGQKGKRTVTGGAPSATVTANVSTLNKASNAKHDSCSISERPNVAQMHKCNSPRTNTVPQNTQWPTRYARHIDTRSRNHTRLASPARSTFAHNYNTRAFPHSWCDESDTSDSSDDTYVPENDGNVSDVTISEEDFESDSSYEVEIPKTTSDLLDEYASNDSDESWTVGMD